MGKRYFSGSNTGYGFWNYFENVGNNSENVHTFILKGGPGVGKSTLMKRVLKEAVSKGYTVEEFYCSGDPGSLDAVRIIEKDVVVVDGTAPHIIDPRFPGIADEIINLGVYIDQRHICEKRTYLESEFEKNRRGYVVAYSYLAAAKELKLSILNTYENMCDKEKMMERVKQICCVSKKHYSPRVRKLFLDGITCKGEIDFHDNIINSKKVYNIKGNGRDTFLKILLREYEGCELELYYDPLLGDVVKHIYFPAEDVWYTSSEKHFGVEIDTNQYMCDEEPEYVSFNKAQIRILINKAVEYLAMSKKAHDDIEKVYADYMDFAGVEKETKKLLEVLKL